MRPLFSLLPWLIFLLFNLSSGRALSQEYNSNDSREFSFELSGNKLFVYSGEDTYSFAPYGDEMLRIGFHFAMDTAYPISYSVDMEPEGHATVEDQGNALHFITSGFEVVIQKDPLAYSVINELDTLLWDGESSSTFEGSRMQFHVEPDAAWFGGGSRAIPMDRAGMDLVMLNQPFYGYGWGQERMNISIPMVVSSEGFALYFENPTPGLLSLGTNTPGLISYEATLGPMSCFVIRSADPDSLMKPYTELTGRQPIPPIWALGYIQSRFGYENEAEAADVVNSMVGQGFPMDAIIFDLQWQGGVGEMGNLAWDLSRFPDPEAMMDDFLDKGVRSICIADPYFTENCQYFSMLSGLGWFAKKQNGTPYIINEFWAGPSGLIDVTKPAAANWFWQRCRNILETGASGLWTDLGEPEMAPEEMYFEAGSSTEVRQTYNLRWAKAIFEGYSQDYPHQRLFNLTRSGYAGMQRYGTFPWSGDVQKSYDGMYAQVPVMLGMGLCGFGYMGHDVGGFVGELDQELYTRWQQMGAFSPIMRAHGVGVITEPVYFDEPYKGIVKSYIQLRYRLLPYNYTLAYINSKTGMPLARPLFFADRSLTGVDDAYLWGNDFLIAPVFEEEALFRYVTLPQGKWMNYYSWETFYGGGDLMVGTQPLNFMPLFVRAGAMIPMIPEIQNTRQYDGSSYIIKYYADPEITESRAMIYLDDGLTRLAALEDEFSIIQVDADYSSGDVTININREGKGYENEPMLKQMVFEVPRTGATPDAVHFNSVSVPVTGDPEVYSLLEDVVLYNDSLRPRQMYVKVQWNSASQAVLEINGLELETDISIAENSLPEVNVFPNPLVPDSRIHIKVDRPGKYHLALQNSTGQQVGTQSIFIDPSGDFSNRFDELFPGKLSPGVFILEITGYKGVSSSVKLVLLD